MIKLSLVGMFVMAMATLALAASTLPPALADEAQPVIVSVAAPQSGVVRVAGSMAGEFAMPKGAVPKVAIDLMASL